MVYIKKYSSALRVEEIPMCNIWNDGFAPPRDQIWGPNCSMPTSNEHIAFQTDNMVTAILKNQRTGAGL